MNKIKITFKELHEMLKLPEKESFANAWIHVVKYGFIFNEFKLSIVDMQQTYKVALTGINEGNDMHIKIIKNQYNDYGLLAKQMRYELNVMKYMDMLQNFLKEGQTFEELYKKNSDFIDIVPVMSFIQYIIIESHNRKYEVIETKERTESGKRKKKKTTTKSKSEYKLLDCIKIYRKSNHIRKEYQITQESWGVRGHFRKLKSGKIVWVKPFTKGKGKSEQKGNNYTIGGNDDK